MKTKVTVEGITHEDLVNLLSTAIYGSSYLAADYEEAIEYDEDDCYEDIMANILLHDGKILFTDYYAEGSAYGDLPHTLDEAENVTYSVTLKDVLAGLEKAANGTFNIRMGGGYEAVEKELARDAFYALANESANFDLVLADALMQIILFNEIIYG